MNTSLFRIVGCLILVLGTLNLQGQHHAEELDAYQHLYEVNKAWKHFKDIAPIEKKHFLNDTKRIRFHLESVIKHLLKVEPKEKSVATQKKRIELLTELLAYAEKESFPENIHHKHRQPYFIDHKGTHCAVGYMMKISGSADLAQQISQEHNYDYLADIKTEGVSDWAATHGFSLKELALIQPGYAAREPFETLGKGTNGPVNTIYPTWNKLYIAGDFDLLDSLPCLNIGVYEMGQLSCLGNGLDGKINGIAYNPYTEELIAVGDLVDGGSHYPMATYDASSGWAFYNIPNRPNAEGLHIIEGYYTNIVIKDPSVVGNEVWANTGVGAFSINYTFHGSVLDVNSTWCVGLFDSVTMHRQGMADTVVYSHNAISIYNNNVLSSLSVTGAALLPDTITSVAFNGSIVYFGGYSNNAQKPSVTRFLNNTLQPLFFEYDLMGSFTSKPPKVLDLMVDFNSGNLYFVGDMAYLPFSGTIWSAIAQYNVGTGALTGYNSFDSSITSVAIFEGDLIIGGSFTSASTIIWGVQQPLNYLAKLSVPNSTTKLADEVALKLFPNPATDRVTVDLGNEDLDVRIEICNALGQVIYQQEYPSTNRVDLPLDGVSGVYLVKVKTADSESVVKVVKQ